MSQTPISSTLFVIEDNPMQLETLTDILEADGLHPIGCISGKEALAACDRHEAYVAILDLRLPDMDGLSILRYLKERIPGINVIINTAYATLESAIDAVNDGAFAYVQKMGDVDELLAHVHRAFHAHLATYSAHLEGEVNARTQELSQANAALRAEIAAHTQAEEALRIALQQKITLLNEVHHRTRNNMTVISALLGFQAKYAKDEHTQTMLNAVQARIDAISLIHTKLHRENLMAVNMFEYITELAEVLEYNYHIRLKRSKHIRLQYDIEPYAMMIDTALSFGLLLHEILSNALQHAFPDDRDGEIRISFHLIGENGRELRVRDTGIGLPDGYDAAQAQTLGFTLINMMVKSLRGTVAIRRHAPGAEIVACFNEPRYKQRL